MRFFRVAVVASLLGFISVCQAADLNDYLGSWVHVKLSKYTVQIEKNGNNGVLVRQTMPSPVSGKLETKSIPAVYKDGVLQFVGGFGALAFDNASGHLTSGNAEYKRPDTK